jgi:hypothetical protein
MRGGPGAGPAQQWGDGQHPGPHPQTHTPFYFFLFFPATSLTIRLALVCLGTMKACGTGNLGVLGDWPCSAEGREEQGTPHL